RPTSGRRRPKMSRPITRMMVISIQPMFWMKASVSVGMGTPGSGAGLRWVFKGSGPARSTPPGAAGAGRRNAGASMPSRGSVPGGDGPLAGLHDVVQEHRDRHRPDTPRDGADPVRDPPDRVERHVPHRPRLAR